MIIAYAIFLMFMAFIFGMMAIGLPDDKADVRKSSAQLTALCLVSLFVTTFWLL